MSIPQAMTIVTELLGKAQALAGLAAHLRLEELQGGEPELRAAVARVVDALGAREAIEDLGPGERAAVVAFARSYLRQALELLERPTEPSAWRPTDSTLLQAQGRASTVVAKLFLDAQLGRSDARILDVGTGVAALAIAFCEAFPKASVVGVDPWEPALALARSNVAAAGLQSRIALVPAVIEHYEDRDGFDLIWFPSFFISPPVLDDALLRLHRLCRPGATIVVGAFDDPADPLASAVDHMTTIRSGGTVLSPLEAAERLRRAGFEDVRQASSTWKLPLQLICGTRR